MLLRVLLVLLCVLISMHWQYGVSGRGRTSSRSRTSSHTYKSHKSSGSGSNVRWFSWFRGDGKSSTTATGTASTTIGRRPVPPIVAHRNKIAQSSNSRLGFAAYGNNYEANFHNHHFRPVSHPYQSHFQPQTTSKCKFHSPYKIVYE